jgi:hypothetical protein
MLCLCRVGVSSLLCAATILGGSGNASSANEVSVTASDHPWTVVTVAPDGSWGVGTKPYIYLAIAEAVSSCKRVYRSKVGCGAQLEAVQAGWILLIRCSGSNITAAGATLANAIRVVTERETALRSTFSLQGPCSHVITVNPDGVVVQSTPGPRNTPEILQSFPEAQSGLRPNR